MPWTNIASANLDIGAPIRSVHILALRDNIEAVPNGDSGAPRIKAEALNGGQSGNAPIYAARAWVNFDGTGTFSPNPSTSAIRGSGNVSSVTKTNTGRYVINFATALPNANFSINTAGKRQNDATNGGAEGTLLNTHGYSTTGVNVVTMDLGGNYVDAILINAGIFG